MSISSAVQDLLQQAIAFVPRLIAALVIFVATLFLSGLAARWAERAARLRTSQVEMLKLLSRLARWTVLVLGVILALDQVNFDLTAFVAGLGIAGFTIGFALQDISRNFVAGILLLLEQPFAIGDAVQIGDFAGSVLDIRLRATELKSWDGEKVILPNIDVFTGVVTNYTQLPQRRRTIHIGLGYGEDFESASALFLGTMQGVEGVLKEPAPTVQAEELGDSSMTLAARFWVNQNTHDLFEVHSRVVAAIAQGAEREGIDLPYPIQTVRLEGALPGGSGDGGDR
jgi:small conductance mechanosensitive channel